MFVQKKTPLVLTLSLSLFLSGCAIGNQTSATTLVPSCSLDGVSGGVQDATGNYTASLSTPDLVLRGWMANGLSGESSKEITVVLADSLGQIYSSKSGPSLSRPDVASVYKEPGMESSGFEILMENVKKPGIYLVTMQANFKGDSVICSRDYTLTVAN